MRSQVRRVAVAAVPLALAGSLAAPTSASSENATWTYVDASRNCDNAIRAKTLASDGKARLSKVLAKARDGHELIPLDVRGDRVLFADFDCRAREYDKIRLATLKGSKVRLATVAVVAGGELNDPANYSATFNGNGSRIVIGVGSQFGSPPDVTLRYYDANTLDLVRTKTLRGVGSMGRLDAGPGAVLYLQTVRETSRASEGLEAVVVPIRGQRVGEALVAIPAPYGRAYSFVSDVSSGGSVAMAQNSDRRVRVIPAGKNPPRATAAKVCGREGIETMTWLDVHTLLVDCAQLSYRRFLVDLSEAKPEKVLVDDFIGGPTAYPVGRR